MAETVYSHESVAEADAHAPVAHIEHDTNTGISNTKLAMWLFLASECLLFGGLITTYLLYRNRARRARRRRRSSTSPSRRPRRSCC